MEESAGMKVLYLSEWYPNKYDNASGRFVRGHAMSAVQQGVDVCVLYLCHAKQPADKEIFTQTTAGIKEVYVYYRGGYLAALRKGWQMVQREWGIPDMCQLNILTKNAVLPLWLKRTHGIPYVIVEHWTGYYPESGAFKKGFRSILAQIAVRHAEVVLTVSTELAEHMQRNGLKHRDYRLVKNVVYDDFFRSRPRKKDGIKRMLHVSYLDEAHKNVNDIIRAVSIVSKLRQDFECVIIGDGENRKDLMRLAADLHIPPQLIRWTGELEPQQVCDFFYQSDFFVFYSNFETAGIVLSESLICGKPVISTAVGIAPDIITEHTGLIVPKRQPEKLAKAMNWMLDHYQEYDSKALRAVGEQYSMEKVGKYLLSTYNEVCR